MKFDNFSLLYYNKDMSMIRGLKFTVKGSDKSGHHGHAGRPGSVGGSAPKGGGDDVAVSKAAKELLKENLYK
ncbi:MAG: hypothetical protein H8D45_03610 [Bacteroidetes bacterium]|nr:hypothetical protein [Bacteroidota bacterium]